LAAGVTATIGSSRENDFVIAWPGVSRRHATITRLGDRAVVNDLGSKNRLLFRGQRTNSVELSAGDIVHIGRARVLIERISTPDADLAIVFEQRASSGASQPVSRSTDAADAVSHPVREVLRWARDAEAGTDRFELLERARRILFVEAFVVYTTNGEIIVRSVEGSLPPDALASLQQDVDENWSAVPLPTGDSLAAYVSDPTCRKQEWWNDFLEHVALKLYVRDTERDEILPRARDQLVVAPEFVSGDSRAMRRVLEELRAVVRSDLNILIRGESGTGKELFARMIHDTARPGSRPFRAVNCAAIPAEILEAELFGVRRHIATGVDARPGLFVEANGGTVFLDEIGDMPERLQPKLLRVLQEREVMPLGAPAPVKIDVRLVSSTNQDLESMIERGTFRHDLYYRIRGAEIVIPPLRDRPEDIPQLVTVFALRNAARHKKRIRGVSRRALELLVHYDWPGNVRELQNAVARAVLRARSGGTLDTSHFDQLRATVAPPPTHPTHLQTVERDAIEEALRKSDGNISAAARLLGITRAGLYLKMKRYAIKRQRN